MKITKTAIVTRICHTVVVDNIPYFRNEHLTYGVNGDLEEQKVTWSVGDKDGKGPYVEPSGPLDHIKKHTSKSLEEKFKFLLDQ
jgi:hypothetical protein